MMDRIVIYSKGTYQLHLITRRPAGKDLHPPRLPEKLELILVGNGTYLQIWPIWMNPTTPLWQRILSLGFYKRKSIYTTISNALKICNEYYSRDAMMNSIIYDTTKLTEELVQNESELDAIEADLMSLILTKTGKIT